MKRAIVFLVIGLAGLAMAGAARAVWSAPGSGSGDARALTLPPGNTPAVSVSGADVTVSWSQVTFEDSPVGTYANGGYLLTRYADGSTTPITPGANCSGLRSGAAATLSCVESAVPDGSWRYAVTPALENWRGAQSAQSDTVTTVNDATPPTSAITFPVAGGVYASAGWMEGCGTMITDDICGTAADVGTGVQKVEISVRRGSGNYWGGTAFDSASQMWFQATGTTDWSYAFSSTNFLVDGQYTIRSRATDSSGNVQSTPTSASFTVDRTAPAITRIVVADSTTSTAGWFTEGGSYFVYARVTDGGSGVSTVTGDVGNITTGATSVPMTTTGGPWTIGGKSYTYRSSMQTANGSAPESGNPYTFAVTATDNVGNSSSFADTANVDNTGPAIARVVVADATTGTAGYFTQGGGYFVYARVTDAGLGVATVTGDVGNLTTGATSVPMTTTGGPWTIGGRSYTHRSSMQTANGSAPESGNPYAFSVGATDNGSHSSSLAGTANVDYTAPAIVRVVVANSANNSAVIRQGGDYFVYARVTDAGSGVATVTGNVGNITTGATSVPMTTTGGSWTIGGRSYNYRSAVLTANGSLPESGNPYSFSVGATDNMGNSTAPFGGTVSVDNTTPGASDVQATNDSGGTIGLAEMNDKITFTFSEQMDPGSIMGGWSGSSAAVTVYLDRIGSTGSVSLTVWDSSGTTQLALGSVDLARSDYLAGTGDKHGVFSGSSMLLSGATVTITLGTSTGDAAASAGGTSTMTWTPSTSAKDPAGNAMSGTSVDETTLTITDEEF